MSTQSYLIDTNIIIGLEDNHTVKPAYAKFSQLAAKHKVDVLVHEAARDDINRDKDAARRAISLSKVDKFQILEKVKGVTKEDLQRAFGRIRKHNDEVDATLLHALYINASDFLVTEDQGLHERAQKYAPDLANRVLFIADAAQLLITTYEPRAVPIRHVADVSAHTIPITDNFFDSLREGYPEFNNWWKTKCVAERRSCWVVYDNDEIAGLIVRKDETGANTDAIHKAQKILKICTFKVGPEKRGVKLGELLLKKVLWFAQKNGYDLAYLTAYPDQDALIALLEFYGFEKSGTKGLDGELVLERCFSNTRLTRIDGTSVYEIDRKSYPRFVADTGVRGFVIPIKEDYHDVLYPDLRNARQPDMFRDTMHGAGPRRPGNTIRKVYLCRAPSNLGPPGSVLFFYKGKSIENPSQALTAVGVLDDVSFATSTKDLMKLTGGRSVYSEKELEGYKATSDRPVKVINYLLVGYIDPPISLDELQDAGIFSGHPPRSIIELSGVRLHEALDRCNFGFSL
ncbi:ribosomal protein S18 acetylase RimI-like enzyme [Rhodovulum sulfidophilum]|uniref:GNAT family N-acetyltransferase n=1 Tax=Rhodovulum sulfidophilum TaxID=35806 RepID=UPI00069736E2|nr:GNAT family N-acetyltransferase [Rhodovulum sulfidophilum]ANB32608.1 GCN5 family acetyltransferase [Rhodovulum sulfidophilum DSM 1374]ANB36459.1 GCN5 family acetyltransferase [Rhodovulum sulfidophilum]MCW2305402.1 ribosomal protein S18 acetylase RimI-like enzyme [Rhodovulum sulfidophilum]